MVSARARIAALLTLVCLCMASVAFAYNQSQADYAKAQATLDKNSAIGLEGYTCSQLNSLQSRCNAWPWPNTSAWSNADISTYNTARTAVEDDLTTAGDMWNSGSTLLSNGNMVFNSASMAYTMTQYDIAAKYWYYGPGPAPNNFTALQYYDMAIGEFQLCDGKCDTIESNENTVEALFDKYGVSY